ncbi:MAG: hypothetical protein AB7R90_00720 [Reyranellaceae bacterium]
MKPTVFIHTNAKQIIGALVAEYALKRNAARPEAFDVRIIRAEDFPFLARHEGQHYRREGGRALWTMNDLQSFTPLRFTVPELMGYAGRAVVMDPDIFAVGDIAELLGRDMAGKAIHARRMPASHRRPAHYASSVMLLDCARLRHWQAERQFAELFEFRRDYRDWMWLLQEPEGTLGELGEEWNHFDTLEPRTRLLHNTHRRTQPWKTGLPADFTPRGTTRSSRTGIWYRRLLHRLGAKSASGYYLPHPDPKQEAFFFGLLRECLEAGIVSEAMLREEIGRRHVRRDAFELLDRARRASGRELGMTGAGSAG